MPQLPASVLAAILDFMRYDDVRSSLLVGKTIADHAAKHVQTLNITKVVQMDSPAARNRFQNIEQVNIQCLFQFINNDPERQNLLPDAASRIVPFLMSFPKLKKVFIGGPWGSRYGFYQSYYSINMCEEPANHKALFFGLVDAFCGAFKSRSLPNNLESLDGIVNNHNHAESCIFNEEGSNQPCVRCREICTHFPLNDVIKHHFNVCLSHIDRCKIVRGRHGGPEVVKNYLKNGNTDTITSFLYQEVQTYTVRDNTEDGIALHLKMEEINVLPDFGVGIRVMYITIDGFALLDDLIEFGFNPKDVATENLEPSRCFDFWENTGVLAKSTFDGLVARGFALPPLEFPIVDERTEPALQELACKLA